MENPNLSCALSGMQTLEMVEQNCEMCEKKCPQHLMIHEELKKVEALFK